MSSYALSAAVQMMTPSTFRRRNISKRKTDTIAATNNKSLYQNRVVDSRTSFPLPPNTLTFQEQGNSNVSLSGNYGLSQLTMSQLSDSMSHHTRSSKVARTNRQIRPSARLPESKRSRNTINRFNPVTTANRVMQSDCGGNQTSSQTNMTSSQKWNQVDVNDTDSQYTSQLRSQEMVFSPPTTRIIRSTRAPLSNPPPGHGNTTPLGSSMKSRQRKRSWMDTCIDVMRTPYRKGKHLASKVTRPLIKIDLDGEIETRSTNNIQPKNAVVEVKSSSINTPDVQDESSALHILNETKSIWKQVESLKEEIEKERKDIENIKIAAIDEIRNEKTALMKVKKDFETAHKDLQSICKDFEKKKDQFAVQIWSAEEKCSAKVREFEVKQTEVLEGMKKSQSNAIQDVATKKKDLMSAFHKKLYSFEEDRNATLNKMFIKKKEWELMLSEMKTIEKKLAVFTPLLTSKTSDGCVSNRLLNNDTIDKDEHAMNKTPTVNEIMINPSSSLVSVPKQPLVSNIVHCSETDSDESHQSSVPKSKKVDQSSLKRISKSDQESSTTITPKSVSKKPRKLAKKNNNITRSSQNDYTNTSNLNTKEDLNLNSCYLTPPPMPKPAPKIIKYGRSTRRRRINGQNVNGNKQGLSIHKESECDNELPSLPRVSDRKRVRLGQYHRVSSPVTIGADLAPPPIPNFDDLIPRRRGNIIAPRFAHFSVDDDSLSFK